MRLTFCTVCRNRLFHLKETFLKNLQDNDQPEVDFVLLDYNSSDGLEQWVFSNLSAEIEMGKVTYYRTFQPEYFHRSHSRNMVFKLAQGSIICNLDADNFLGPGFAFWLKECFNTDQNIFVCAGSISDRLMSTDVAGRICVRKEDFDALGGFDESMSGYGFEDFDLIERLESSQIKKRIISNSLFLKAISHSIKTRVIEEFEYRNIETILVSYKTPYKSKMIFLFRNNVFSTGSILNNVSEESSMPSLNTKAYPSNIMLLSEEAWHYGTWTKFVASAFNGIHLEFESDSQMNTSLNFNQSTSTFINQFEIYFIINDRHKIEEAIAYYSQIKNRTTMNRNMGAPNKCVNSGAMGKGIVFKNFDYNTEIRL